MPSFDHCLGVNCEVKARCYRHTALADKYSLWMAFWQTAGFTPEHGCEYMEPLPATGTDGYALRGDHETTR
jgi:hypothetical protein